MDHPADIARPVTAQQVRPTLGLRAAKQILDLVHGVDEALLVSLRKLIEHSRHVRIGARVEGSKDFAPAGCKGEEASATIALRRRPIDEPALLKSTQDAAEITRIQTKIPAQFDCARLCPISKFVKNTHLGQGKRALVNTLSEQTDLAGVEAVETSHPLDVSAGTRLSRHVDIVNRLVDLVK